ncbi:MAG: hypothetical protein ACLGI6_09300 [Gammaproteobacteria bacterium]
MNDKTKDHTKDHTKQQQHEDSGNQQRASNQGGHQGYGGHGGQHSGGMGGERGGDLHDVGSGQSGMTGSYGSGGTEAEFRGAGRNDQSQQQAQDFGSPADDIIGIDEVAEVQQSAQREGMGNHRHSNRGNEQAIDAVADVDKLGNHVSSAAKSRPS